MPDVIDEIITHCKRLQLKGYLGLYAIAKQLLLDAQDDGEYPADPAAYDVAIKRITKALGI
jgi:hypothetical protein